MLWILVGILIGILMIKLQPKAERWHNRQISRHVLQARLNEISEDRRNGRENGDLTVKIDPVS